MDTAKMASVISVTANEVISVNNEHGDNKINPMALKMKENYQTNVSTVEKPTLAIEPITTNYTLENNQEQLHTDREDIYSIKGRFAWKSIEKYQVPYITRVINCVELNFVSVRMAETQLLSNSLFYLHSDIYTCKSIRSHFITDNEAKLLNEINYHTNFAFGKKMFLAKKECIVLLEDVHELYTFIEVCLKTLLLNIHTGRKENCGFVRINSESVVPYCIKNSQKYVPLFCFEGETEQLQHLAIQLENWNLAYLKFCCKVQGISNEYFFDESWTVISLDDVKNCYSTETHFEEYWPPQGVIIQLLMNQKSIPVNTSGAWARPPSEVVVAKNTIPHTLTASAKEIPQSMPVTMATYQNEWPANQMVHSISSQAQSPSTTARTLENSIAIRTQSLDAQCYNAGSTVTQNSSLINGVGHDGPPSTLIRACDTAPTVSHSVSHSNATPSSQWITTMTNSDMISDSNQKRNSYNQCAINNSQAQPQLIQQQHRQQIITTLQTQSSYSSQSVHGRLTDGQPHIELRNAGSIVTSVATEVDIPLPPSSSVPPKKRHREQETTSISPSIGWESTNIPERIWGNDTNISAYQGSTVSQNSSLINGVGHDGPPSTLIRACDTAPTVSHSVSHSNATPSSQWITTMTNSDMISDSNQKRNSYNQCAINNSQAQPQLIQQQHRQQIITTLQTQSSYSSQSVHGRLTDGQPPNALRNARSIVTTVATEVDIPLPPSSSVHPKKRHREQETTSISPSVGWELTNIPERIWGNGTNISAYQIQKTTLQGKPINCINANPYIYSDLLITLEHLVQIVLPSWTVERCAYVFQKYLKITLFRGNSEQLGVLWKKGLLSLINPEDTPMAMLQDIKYWLNTGATMLQMSHQHQSPNSLMQNASQSCSNRPPPPPYM